MLPVVAGSVSRFTGMVWFLIGGRALARVPGGFGVNDAMGVQRPDRSVSMGQAWADALLARARQEEQYRPVQEPAPNWVSNVTNSAVGQILGQPSMGDMQTAFAERAAQGVSMTPAAMMQQQRLAGGIDEALDWVRPLALADLGVAGAAGRAMIPIPGGLAPGAAPAARTARRAGGGIAGALRQLLSRGGDEAVSAVAPVVRETTEAAGRASRPYYRNVDELEAAAQPAWKDGPTLFHGGPADMSGFSALGEGNAIMSLPAMGNATYTTPNMSFASLYANQGSQARGAIFRGTHAPPTPSVVQNVKFAGEGAPLLIDYGKAGIDEKAQQAVLKTIGELGKLLAEHPGSLPIHRTELEPLLAKLRHPRTTFADIHGFAGHASTGPKSETLRGMVEAVVRRNTETGPFRPAQLNEMVSNVMNRLNTNLSDAGYHGFAAPSGGGFHRTHQGHHSKAPGDFGDSIAWFNPRKDLEIVATGQHNVMGVVHPSGRLGTVPSGYRADNWFGSPTEVASRFE